MSSDANTAPTPSAACRRDGKRPFPHKQCAALSLLPAVFRCELGITAPEFPGQ